MKMKPSGEGRITRFTTNLPFKFRFLGVVLPLVNEVITGTRHEGIAGHMGMGQTGQGGM